MGKIIELIKKGNVELKIPERWSRKKSWYVGLGLMCLSVVFGAFSYQFNNMFYLYLCILTAFFSGQIYYIVYHWDEVKKIEKEKEVGKCVFLIDLGEGQWCAKGFTTTYQKVSKFEPICGKCKRKTIEVKNAKKELLS